VIYLIPHFFVSEVSVPFKIYSTTTSSGPCLRTFVSVS